MLYVIRNSRPEEVLIGRRTTERIRYGGYNQVHKPDLPAAGRETANEVKSENSFLRADDNTRKMNHPKKEKN